MAATLEEMTRSRLGSNDAFFNQRVAEFKNRGVPGASNGDLVQPGGELAKLHSQWDAEMAAKNPAAATPAAEKVTLGGLTWDFTKAGFNFAYASLKHVPGIGHALNGFSTAADTYRVLKSTFQNGLFSQETFKHMVDWGVHAYGSIPFILPGNNNVAAAYDQGQAVGDVFDVGRNVKNYFTGDAKTYSSAGGKLVQGAAAGYLIDGLRKGADASPLQKTLTGFIPGGIVTKTAVTAGLGFVYEGVKSLVSSKNAPPRAAALS